MELEETLPNKPKFGAIVGLFAATIIVAFGLVLLIMHFAGHDLIKHRIATPDQAKTSSLWTPSARLAA